MKFLKCSLCNNLKGIKKLISDDADEYMVLKLEIILIDKYRLGVYTR